MKTIKFPNMFNSNSTNVWKAQEYLESTKQSAVLLLQSERYELFGDPFYGLLFKHYLFSQNGTKLKDIVIDMIYTQLVLFLPQLRIDRKDIDVIQDREKGKLYCSFSGINQIDYQLNTYNLVLYSEQE